MMHGEVDQANNQKQIRVAESGVDIDKNSNVKIDQKDNRMRRRGGRTTIMQECTLGSRLCVPGFRLGCPLQMPIP